MRERKRKPTHPGIILKYHYLEPLDLSITELADTLGVSRKTISAIVNERASVTPDLALRLSRALQTTPELWLNLQQVYNLWVSIHQNKEWKRVPVLKLQILNAAV
ncbi:MAG: HigA family addiction module antidote protein [Deltaproteobacteria bacterium]|nr:MAG: HigA family addiction module antidote protein [Deltaproteobacteria bacterium]